MSKALVIVDMCRGFVEEEVNGNACAFYMESAGELIPEINKYIKKHLNAETDYVVHVNDSHHDNDIEIAKTGMDKHCMWDTEETETAPGFEYGDVRVTEMFKNTFSGFHNTPLNTFLRKRGVTDIVVVGVATEICVFYTAIDGVRLGYNVVVERGLTRGTDEFGDVTEACMGLLEHHWGIEVR